MQTSQMKFRPLSDRVIVKRDEEKTVTEGGLFLPDQAKAKPFCGTVLATGPGRVLETGQRAPMEVKEKDRVLFGRYAGADVPGYKDVLIMGMNEIIAVQQEGGQP